MNEDLRQRIASKPFDDLTDDEIEEIRREIAKTPEGKALLLRVGLPAAKRRLFKR